MYNKKNLISSGVMILFVVIFLVSININLSAQTTIGVVDLNKINNLIQNREGKPLLINIWATWCVPCREEFPDLIKVADKYKKEVDVVGISVDFPDEINSKILPFAQKNKVNFKLYVNSETDQEKFITYFDKDWNGAIPVTFLYDSNGKQVKRIYGKQDFNYFTKTLNQHLKK